MGEYNRRQVKACWINDEIYEMEIEDHKNMQMNILNCLDILNSIKDKLGFRKVKWER